MRSTGCLQASQRLTWQPLRPNLRRVGRCQSQSGRTEPFNEGAVQVKRLVNRDRKELLGNKIDILDKYTTEFGDPDDDSTAPSSTTTSTAAAVAAAPASSSNTPSSSATPSSPFAAKPAAVATKFTGSSSVSSPFGTANRNRSSIEPKGLSPDMGPDPIVNQAPTPGNFLSKITLTQVVLFFTFSSMIGLMLVTFYVVVNTGAVRLAGID